MPPRLAARVIRKRKRLYTQSEIASALGVSVSTIKRIEARPLDPLLTRYLSLVGYNVAFYPVRKGAG